MDCSIDAFLSARRSLLERAIVDALHDGVPLDDIVVFAGSEVGTLDRSDAIDGFGDFAPGIARSLARAPESPGVHVIAIVSDQIVLCRFEVSCVRHEGSA